MRVANVSGRLAVVTPAGAVDVAAASGDQFGPDPMAVHDQWDRFAEWAGWAFEPASAEPVQLLDRDLGHRHRHPGGSLRSA